MNNFSGVAICKCISKYDNRNDRHSFTNKCMLIITFVVIPSFVFVDTNGNAMPMAAIIIRFWGCPVDISHPRIVLCISPTERTINLCLVQKKNMYISYSSSTCKSLTPIQVVFFVASKMALLSIRSTGSANLEPRLSHWAIAWV